MFCARAISCCILESLDEARVEGDVKRRGRTLTSDEFESRRRRSSPPTTFFSLLRLTHSSLGQQPPAVQRRGECGGRRGGLYISRFRVRFLRVRASRMKMFYVRAECERCLLERRGSARDGELGSYQQLGRRDTVVFRGCAILWHARPPRLRWPPASAVPLLVRTLVEVV